MLLLAAIDDERRLLFVRRPTRLDSMAWILSQVAEEVFTLSRVVRTFGTEKREGERYSAWLKRLTHLSVRQAAAYLLYLTTNSGLYYLTKVDNTCSCDGCDPASTYALAECRCWPSFCQSRCHQLSAHCIKAKPTV